MKWHTYLSLIFTGIGIGWLVGLSVSPVVSIVITSIVGVAAAITATMSGLDDTSSEIKQADRYQISILRKSINPFPLAVLVIGVFGGTIIGISARNQSWLGSNVSGEIQKWTDAGLHKEEVVRRLFDLEYPYTPHTEFLIPIESTQATSITASLVLSSELKMWTDLGLNAEDVARRLFDARYQPQRIIDPSTITNNDKAYGSVLYATFARDCDLLSNYLLPSDNGSLGEDKRLRDQVAATQFRGLSKIIEDPEVLRKVLEELCTLS